MRARRGSVTVQKRRRELRPTLHALDIERDVVVVDVERVLE